MTNELDAYRNQVIVLQQTVERLEAENAMLTAQVKAADECINLFRESRLIGWTIPKLSAVPYKENHQLIADYDKAKGEK